jgi:hypothetical protein|tara:strand:- start:84 stop:254 length:171 start_codon:yes stop_codon:yes gene_type:complete
MKFTNQLYEMKTITEKNGDTHFEISDPRLSMSILIKHEDVQALAVGLLKQKEVSDE